MGFVCGRRWRAAMLPAKRKGRIVIEFSGTGSAQGKPGKCANSYWHKLHITSARGSFSLFKQLELAASLLPGPEPASDCAHEAQNMEVGLTDCFSRLRAESGNGKDCDALHTSRFCTSNAVHHGHSARTICAGVLWAVLTDDEPAAALVAGPHELLQDELRQAGSDYRDRRSAWRRRAPDHRCRSARQCCEPHGGASVAPWCVPVSHVRAAGCVRRTITGVRAARSPRVPRSGLWPPRPPRHGPVRRRRPATAGTTPIQAGPRVSGTSVRNSVRLEWAT